MLGVGAMPRSRADLAVLPGAVPHDQRLFRAG